MMADPGTGLPSDNVDADRRAARRYTSPTNIGAYLWSTVAARDLGLIRAARRPRACARTLDSLAGLERHEAQRPVLQLVRPAHRREADHLAGQRRTGLPVPVQRRQRLAGGRAAHGRSNAEPGCAREARGDRRDGLRLLLRPAPRAAAAAARGRSRRRAAACPATTATARTSTSPATTTARSTPSRGSPPTSASPTGRSRPSTTSACCARCPPAATGAWQEQRPEGVTRTYLGVEVFEGHYTYRGMDLVPSWGGSMFEALMVPLLVPEEQWGTRSLGRQPPAARARADRARARGGRLRLLGLLARPTTRTAATASTASTRSAWSPTATRPTRSAHGRLRVRRVPPGASPSRPPTAAAS